MQKDCLKSLIFNVMRPFMVAKMVLQHYFVALKGRKSEGTTHF